MSLDQKRARSFGVFYLITFVTSIPALWLYEDALRHPLGFIAGAGNVNKIYLGALLELLLIIANIGTAVVIYPDHAAAVRRAVDRLRDGEDRRVHVHPRRHRRDARDRHACNTRVRARPKARSRTRSRRSRTGRSCSGRAGSSAGGTA